MGMESTMKNNAMLTIFVVAIVTFAISFAADNDSPVSLADDSRYNDLKSGLKSEAEQLEADATTAQTALLKTTLESGDEHASSGGQFKVGPYTAMFMTVFSLKRGFDTITGGSTEFAWILGLFAGLFTILIGYYIVKAWLGRDPS
jgi:hypothetical protein